MSPSVLRSTLTTLLFFSGTAAALESPAPAVSTGSMMQITFSLLLVLAAILLVAWLLRRLNLTQQGSGNFLKVLGSVPIGQRERVVLVEAGDTWLVVGVGPGQIRTLHTLAKGDPLPDAAVLQSDNKFATLLNSMLKPRTGSKHVP